MMNGNNKTPAQSQKTKPQPCKECDGRGWLDSHGLRADQAHRCPYCDGKGVNVLGRPCYGCSGTGLLDIPMEDKHPCPQCGGAGVWPVPPSLAVDDYAFSIRKTSQKTAG
jgi:DnaJ-class molecular chaperone